jgi:hypothetical protein
MSNLPPGVRVSDIPGAVPSESEAAAEAFFDKIAMRRELRRLDEASVNELCERLWRLDEAAYALGYQHGAAVERELPLLRSVNPARRGHLFARHVESLLVEAYRAGLMQGGVDEANAQSQEDQKKWQK